MAFLKTLLASRRRKKIEASDSSNQPDQPSAQVHPVRTTTLALPEHDALGISQGITKGSNLGLQVLYDPAVSSKSTVDIVFVHGLTGNAYSTWLHKESEMHWPSQILHNEISDARIMVWGYDANVTSFWGHAARNRLGEHAKNLMGDLVHRREETESETRRIIFVTHSLGGLVVQKTLSVSRERAESHLRQIESCTSGIIFLGTPHHGSDLASWALLCTKLVSTFRDVNRDILRTLEHESEILRDTQDIFGQLLRIRQSQGTSIQITCFFEEKAVTAVGMIVPFNSAALFGYTSYGIPSNHMDMTKFASREDVGYRRITGELKRWVKVAGTAVKVPVLSTDQEEILRIISSKGASMEARPLNQAIPGTLEWIWSDPRTQFLPWIQTGGGPYWVTGNPGSGKTTVMNYLIQNRTLIARALQGNWSSNPVFVTYAFSYEGDHVQRSIEGLLRSIIYDILLRAPQLFTSAFPSIQTTEDFRQKFLPWSEWQLEQAIYKALEAGSSLPFVIFVDGLDECKGDNARIAQFVDALARRLPLNLRLCVSSRPEADFVFQFANYHTFRVEQHSNEDIQLYVRERFREAQPFLGETSETLAQKVIEKAQGVFLWVKLVMDSLQRGWRRYESSNHLEHRLREMPPDLVDLYQRVIEEMDPEEKHEACRLLVIVAFAQRSLTVRELYFASLYSTKSAPKSEVQNHAGNSPKPDESQDNIDVSLMEKRIPIISRSLLQIHAEYQRPYVLHETVHTFIRQRMIGTFDPASPLPRFHGNFLLLSACVGYLTSLFGSQDSTELSSWSLMPRKMRARSEEQTDIFSLGSVWLGGEDYISLHEKKQWRDLLSYPIELGFLHYAIQYWLRHAFEAELETQSGNNKIINSFSVVQFDLWRRLFQIHNPTEGRKMPVNLLAVALETGLSRYALEEIRTIPGSTHLLSGPIDLPFHYLLFAAAKLGDIEIVQNLLAKGAPLAPDEYYGSGLLDIPPPSLDTPMQARIGSLRHWGQASFCRAVHFDRSELVGFLLDHGLSLTMNTPVPISKLWLETGGIYQTKVLSRVAGFGNLQRSRRSVSRGRTFVQGEQDDSWSIQSTPWMEKLYQNVQKYSLQEDTKDSVWESVSFAEYQALNHAIERRSYEVLSTLIDFAKAKGLRSELNQALVLASHLGLPRAVKALLQGGAEATWSRRGRHCLWRDGKPCCSLIPAAENGYFENVALLLRAGADPNFSSPKTICQEPHGNPLDVAIHKLTTYTDNEKYQAVVTQMLQYGGRINPDACRDDQWASILPFLMDTLEFTTANHDMLSTIQKRIKAQQIVPTVPRRFSFEPTEEGLHRRLSL